MATPWTSTELERSGVFWGKVARAGTQYLPLAAHCLDVGMVFRSLCDLDGTRRTLFRLSVGSLADQQLDRLAVLAMLHDAGKANLGFQLKIFDSKAAQAGHIRELAPLLDLEALDEDLHESFMSSLPEDIHTWFPDGESAYSYLLAVFSHHGWPLRFGGEKTGTYWLARKEWWHPQAQRDPMAAVASIIDWGRRAFPRAFEGEGPPLPGEPRFHHRVAGLVMLADWLGSHQYWFPVNDVSLEDRLRHNEKTIPLLLRTVGLHVTELQSQLQQGPQDFAVRFEFAPYPLQEAVDALDPEDPGTPLIIAESETGSGKTEAALDWFFKLFACGKVDSLYFALPTRVAARELYGRVHRTIERWFPDDQARPVTVLAVPGYAEVDGVSMRETLPQDEESNRWQDDDTLRRRERQWAAERPKRFLAATVAVGTIDQALLSGVQTAHAHLRSVCLDRSLLVVDEVHASDVYMSRLLSSLLKHHLGTGGRAMLLSATLGARARHEYVSLTDDTKTLLDLHTAQQVPYPALSMVGSAPRSVGSSSTQAKRVLFEGVPVAFRPEAVAERLVRALAEGARILVVMNTVARANALMHSLEGHAAMDDAWWFSCHGVICPHHGRFAPEDRELLDAEVSKRLGSSSPPGPVLLIGTQTLEQSLDIDADFMVSDLAPADVLLQRVGRLHRHKRARPSHCEEARCLLLTPEQDLETALDRRGNVTAAYKKLGYGSVYEDLRTLELTRRTLTEAREVSIPRDNRYLVEQVTHPESLSSLEGEGWSLHGQNIEGGELARTINASHAAAVFDKHFGEFEFNESGGEVVTRLGANNLQLPLNDPIKSPFGQTLRQIVIPGHMAPQQPSEEVTVEDIHEGVALLRCADRRYRYSRFGLEVDR